MKETTYVIDPERVQNIFRQMTTAESNRDLLACLMDMQTRQGIDEAAAKANAHRCMQAIAAQEGLKEELSENAAAVLEKAFAGLAKKAPEQRLEALHQIYFGLTIHSNPTTDQQLAQGNSPEALYQMYRVKADPALTPEVLENQIRQTISQFRLPPHVLRGLAWQMRHGQGYYAAAEALGENGRNLKCLLAMDIWLQKQTAMTMEEAAVAAATSVEAQAVTDALNRGYIARDIALTLLTILGLSVAVFGMFQFISFLPEAMMTASEIWAMGGTLAEAEARLALARKWVLGGLAIETGGLALNEFAGELAARIGTVATRFSPMLRSADNQAAEHPEALAEEAEAEMGYAVPDPSLFVSVDLPDEDENEDGDEDIDTDPVFF